MIRMLTLRLLLVALVCVAVLDLAARLDPGPPPLLIHAKAADCAEPPVSLLPRDRWHGAQIKRSKDGGTA